jgi:uncharacterized membrane protein
LSLRGWTGIVTRSHRTSGGESRVPKPAFALFEGLVVVLTAVCLRHAAKQGRRRALEFVSGIVFGLILEILTIYQLQAYHYGRFVLMIGPVPLAVGMGWGVILYAVMETSDSWNLPGAARPWVDALLALSIDLSMDAIAIRMGMWSWAYYGEWFGVPLANFFAWFVVVAAFSGATRSLRGRLSAWLAAPLAVILSLVVLVSADSLYVTYATPNRQVPVLAALALAACLVAWSGRRSVRAPVRMHWTAAAVPLSFHAFFIAMLIAFGYYRAVPALLAVCLGSLVLSLGIHLAPLRRRLRDGAGERANPAPGTGQR